MSGREFAQTATRRGPPSQILVEPFRFEGDLATWLTRRPDGLPTFSYRASERMREPHARDGCVPWAAAPDVTWIVGDRRGALSPMGFIAAWNAALEEVDGIPIGMRVERSEAIGLPWIWPHPSGCLQAVRFDATRSTFVRRLLYKTGP